MKTRYATFYRTIPSLGRETLGPAGTVAPVRPLQTAPHPVHRQPSVLETMHADIVQAITLLWGYPEMNVYFEKLWLDDGSRGPIAPEAMSELMLLAGVHQCLAPQRPARNMASIYDAHAHAASAPKPLKDIWASVPRRR
jgi:hypothetical protein